MKKKVFVLILALFMLMPVSGVFAYTSNDNFINEAEFVTGILGSTLELVDEMEYIRDQDITTSYVLPRNSILLKFNDPKDISHYKIKAIDATLANFALYFYDESQNFLSSKNYLNFNNSFTEIYVENVTYVRILNVNSRLPVELYEIGLFNDGSFDKEPPSEISNIKTEQNHNSIVLNYDLPPEEDFKNINIYFNDEVIETIETSHEFFNLLPDTQYQFKITTVDEVLNESEGIIINVTTDAEPELQEIHEVNAEASHNRVDLSWSLPDTEYFEHVNIYRKSVSDVQTFSLLSVDEYDPLFETNGTYFNDLTVEEQTTYDYKLTTEFQGLESEGVTVQVTTLAAPPPGLGGQEFEEQENGDYLVTWQQPETGQVRILVDGQEYVVVPATDKQYTIPASDMKYSALGDPLVGLQTIGENGEESEIVTGGSNVDLPFGAGELIETSAGLLRFVGSLILLGLSFILVPKFIKVIKQSLNNKKNAESERTEREQRVSERAYREPRESRISTREGRTSTRVSRPYRKGE